jgi:hypothetical protein
LPGGPGFALESLDARTSLPETPPCAPAPCGEPTAPPDDDPEVGPAAASPADFEMCVLTRVRVIVRVEVELVTPCRPFVREPAFESAARLGRTTGANGAFAAEDDAPSPLPIRLGPAIAAPAMTEATARSATERGPTRARRCLKLATAVSSARRDGIREASGMKTVWGA